MKTILNRDDAPFDKSFWNSLDKLIVELARKRLSARKILETEQLNVETYSIPYNYKKERNASDVETIIAQGRSPVHFITRFNLSAPQVEFLTNSGIETGVNSVVKAVNTMTEQEDKLLFYGMPDNGIQGIFSTQGVKSYSFPLWDSPGAAVDTILSGIDILDRDGFHGPYSLALSNELYAKLFKKYQQSGFPDILNVKTLVEDGIVKSSVLDSCGVLIASGTEYASAIICQDLAAGFEGPSGIDFVFSLSECISLKVNTPEAICLLNIKK